VRINVTGTAVLLFALLLLPSALAAGITITANQTDYYFAAGQNAALSLPVSSTYSGAINATIRVTTVEQLQNAGTVLNITRNNVWPLLVPAGNLYLNFSAGTSTKPESVMVRVACQYTDGAPVLVTLPDISVHFVQNLSLYAGLLGSPVASSSGAGLPGGLGNSSVNLSPRFVSPNNQSGRDVATSYSPSSSLSSQDGQIFEDTSALKAQIMQAAAQQAENQNRFNANLAADPLFQKVNATLAADGFFSEEATTNPTDSGNGTFDVTCQDATGSQVSLAGAMASGVVSLITEQSSAEVNVTPALSANATYQAFSHELTDAGFERNQTLMNVTLTSETVNVTYISGQDPPVFVRAEVDRGNVTQVSLDRATAGMTGNIPGIIAAVLVVLLAGIWQVARYFKRRHNPPVFPAAGRPKPAEEAPDYRAELLGLLREAEAAFARREHKEAYGLAGRATRLFFLRMLGVPGELSNAELEKVLAAAGPGIDSAGIIEVLDRCSDVAFARGTPDAGEFSAMIEKIRARVSAKSNHGTGQKGMDKLPDTAQ
jgi:hypothetical protein